MLAFGFNLVTGVPTVRPVHAVGYKGSREVTIRGTKYALPAHTVVDELNDRMYTSSLTLIGSTTDAQRHALNGRAGVEPTSSVTSVPELAHMVHSSIVQAQVADMQSGRFTAALTHSVESYRVSALDSLSTSKEFRDAVATLPTNYDELGEDGTTTGVRTQYRNFIMLYGTHYIEQVLVGGRVQLEASVETCVAFDDLVAHTDAVTAIELALADGAAQNMANFDGVYHGLAPTMSLTGGTEASMDDGGLNAWATSVHGRPQAIGYQLRDIRDAMDAGIVKTNMGRALNAYYAEVSASSNVAAQDTGSGSGDSSGSGSGSGESQSGRVEVTVAPDDDGVGCVPITNAASWSRVGGGTGLNMLMRACVVSFCALLVSALSVGV